MKIAGCTAMVCALLVLAACDKQAEGDRQDQVETALSVDVVPDYVTQAVADPARAGQSADDARRKPLEILTFSGVKPGDRVLELIPGAGYWTRMLSKIVGPQGRVYAIWPIEYARHAGGNVADLQATAATEDYSNVTVEVQPTPVLTAPESLDLVFTSMNYHDYPDEFMGNNDPAVLNDAVFAMLKPGGTYIVIDHAAAPGSGMRDTRELHRIDPESVRAQVEAAGFEYVGMTDVLRNPDDQYDVKIWDDRVRGRTDKFALKFRKPQ